MNEELSFDQTLIFAPGYPPVTAPPVLWNLLRLKTELPRNKSRRGAAAFIDPEGHGECLQLCHRSFTRLFARLYDLMARPGTHGYRSKRIDISRA
jgi:hypothetical protein